MQADAEREAEAVRAMQRKMREEAGAAAAASAAARDQERKQAEEKAAAEAAERAAKQEAARVAAEEAAAAARKAKEEADATAAARRRAEAEVAAINRLLEASRRPPPPPPPPAPPAAQPAPAAGAAKDRRGGTLHRPSGQQAAPAPAENAGGGRNKHVKSEKLSSSWQDDASRKRRPTKGGRNDSNAGGTGTGWRTRGPRRGNDRDRRGGFAQAQQPETPIVREVHVPETITVTNLTISPRYVSSFVGIPLKTHRFEHCIAHLPWYRKAKRQNHYRFVGRSNALPS